MKLFHQGKGLELKQSVIKSQCLQSTCLFKLLQGAKKLNSKSYSVVVFRICNLLLHELKSIKVHGSGIKAEIVLTILLHLVYSFYTGS